MGLIRGMARTAVIAGTATSVSNRVSRRQSQRWSAEDTQSQPEYEAPAQPTYTDPTAAQLQQLADLQRQGVITPEEFAAKKKSLLGI
jgi:hypothetical protein